MPNLTEKEYFDKYLTSTPPEGTGLQVGDKVTFTNDYGVQFHDMYILGFNGDEIHLRGQGAAFWFPKKIEQIKKG